MKWRLIKSAVGIVLTVVVSLGMFAFGNGFGALKKENYSETFLGCLSDTSYKSKVDSVKAFLENEIKGVTSTPQYIGYEKISDLTSAELRKLEIDRELEEQVESAELITVFYKCSEDSYYRSVYDDEDEEDVERKSIKQIESCIVKMLDGYRYYSYLSTDGEALTNSYFKTVLDGSKYLNCTSTTTLNMRTFSDNMVSDANYRQTIKFDDDIASFDQDLPGMTNKMFFTEDNGDIEVYLEHPVDKDGKFYSLSDLNREFRRQNMEVKVFLIKGGEQIAIDTLSVMQDVTDFMFMMQLDASYFVKTDFGFSMPDNKYKEVCKLMVDENTYSQMAHDWERYHVYFNSDYYVTEGRLSGSKTVLTMSNGDDIFALTIDVDYTDFGTTEVVLPEITENE